MNILLLALRLLLLAGSCTGYLLWLVKYVRCEFAVGIMLSGIGSVMFLAGILNLLSEAAWLICLCGMFMLIKNVCRGSAGVGKLWCPGMMFFILTGVFFIYLLYGSKFTHWDSFSHWAKVVKVIIRNDAFPNFRDTEIGFPAYPTGSAAMIYYVAKITGNQQEWLQMWTQAMLMAGSCTAVFAFAKTPFSVLTAIGGSFLLMCGNAALTDLLVDTLLPITALGGMAFCIYYRQEIGEKLVFLIPYLVFLVGIKNSGLLFSLFLIAFVLVLRPGKAILRRQFIAVAAAPALTWLLWEKHVDQVYSSEAALSNHAMSLGNYQSIFQEKSPEEILAILKRFLNTLLTSTIRNWLLLGAAILLWLLWAKQHKGKRDSFGILFPFTFLCYGAYVVGMLGTYLFSMKGSEATLLAGFDRYHRSILLLLWGILLIAHLELIQSQDVCGKIGKTAALTVITLCLAVFSIQPYYFYFRQDLKGTQRERMDELIENYQIPHGKRYLLMFDENQPVTDYLYFMTTYLLEDTGKKICTPATVADVSVSDYDYVLLLYDTPETRACLQELFPDRVTTEVMAVEP